MIVQFEKKREFNGFKLNWVLIGPKGAMHLWVDAEMGHGGMEVHRLSPPEGDLSSCDNEKCWTHGKDCWHDGSSLYWIEKGRFIVANCLIEREDDAIWTELKEWYAAKFPEPVTVETTEAAT